MNVILLHTHVNAADVVAFAAAAAHVVTDAKAAADDEADTLANLVAAAADVISPLL